MDLAKTVQLINAIRAAAEKLYKDTNGQVSVARAVKALSAEMTPDLPVKADGSTFTADEIHAAAMAARPDWLDVVELTK